MPNMLETLIQTISKDLLELQKLDPSANAKLIRKELSLLRQRIESAKKLANSRPVLLDKLKDLHQQTLR